MNTFDKNSLFALSYAFMRRFGFVHINNPSIAQLRRIIEGRVEDNHLKARDGDKIKLLIQISPREIGPAILIDILNYMKERKSEESFFESLVAYVLPQYEGLSVEDITDFFKAIKNEIGDNKDRMRRYLQQLFDIDIETWD